MKELKLSTKVKELRMFANIEQLEEAFVTRQFALNETISVNGIDYRLHENDHVKFKDVFVNKVGMMVYVPISESAPVLALVWRADQHNNVMPSQIVEINSDMVNEALSAPNEPDPKIIGDTVNVKVTSMPNSNPINAKVDTGATISSLHDDRYKAANGQVQFVCPQLSNNVITVPLTDQQAVKSADGGTEYRPVIELNIKINDKLLSDCQFNLNDRGTMEHPMLIGQNVLEKGKFLIDPTMEGQEFSWEQVITEVKEKHDPFRYMAAEELYETIKKSNVSFFDLIHYITTLKARESNGDT